MKQLLLLGVALTAISATPALAATRGVQYWGANTSGLQRLEKLEPVCRSGDPKAAIEACTQMIGNTDATPRVRAIAYSNRGSAHMTLGEAQAAIDDFTVALRFDPHDPSWQTDEKAEVDANIHLNRGLTYASRGEQAKAMADYAEAIRLNPKLVDAYRDRAAAYANAGDPTHALADYSDAIRADPAAGAWRGRGETYAGMGDFQRALADYDEAIRRDPSDAVALDDRSRAYKALGQLDKAADDERQALAHNGDLGSAHVNLGEVLSAKGQGGAAIAQFDAAIKADPKYLHALIARGDAYAARATGPRPSPTTTRR